MKKRLEKIILVITLVFVIGIKNVSALSVNDKVTISKNGSTGDANITYSGFTVSNYHMYQIGTGEAAYCLDPALNIRNNNTYTVSSSSVDALANGDTAQAAYLIGMAAIISESESSGYSYLATSFALRTFSVGTFGQTQTCYYGTSAKYLQSAFINLAKDWNSEGGSAINTVVSAVRSSSYYSLGYENTPSTGYSSNSSFTATGDTSTLSDAKTLYMIGMEAAAEVFNGSTTGYGTASISGSVISKDATNGEIYMKITANDFSSDGFVTNISISGINNPTLYVRSNGTYVGVSSTANFLDYANSNGEIYLKVTYSTASCSSSQITVTYNYYTSNMPEYTVYLLTASGSNGSCPWQSFISYMVTGSADGCTIGNASSCAYTGSFVDTISCTSSSACPTSLSSPICSDNDSESTATIEGPTDIKKCILDGEDEAKNTYQLGSGNGGLTTNSYCSIYCKEDYSEIKFNEIVENVVCGGYFQLSASITGTKTCYTGGDGTTYGDGSIDYDKYVSEVKAAQDAILDAYTRYQMATKAIIALTQGDYDYQEYNNSYCNSYYSSYTISVNYTVYGATYNSDGSWKSWSNSTATDSYGWTGSTETVTDGDSYCVVGGYDYDECIAKKYTWKTDDDTCNGDGSDGSTYDQLMDHYVAIRNQAESDLSAANSNLAKIINEYNQCTTWSKMSYGFKQTVKFYYNELQSDGTYSPYYDLLVGTNEYYMDKDGDESETDQITVCTGTTDTYYDCKTGDTITLGGTSIADGTSSVFKTENFVTATTSSINTYEDDISQATFIKWSITKSQDYISPSVFCQVEATGAVVLCSSGYTGTSVTLETLINSLPVSTASTGGVFKLILENFGEYFKDGTYGRIFSGNLGSYLNYSSDSALSDDGTYTCYYESPCTPEDKNCPNCDIACVGDSCSWDPTLCPDCIVTCVNCLFEEGELTVSMKTISTTNFTSVNRSFGYNWVTTSTLSTMTLINTNLTTADLELIGDKAEQTISEIESDNETIYDSTSSTSYSKTSSDDSSLGFSIKLTSDVIDAILAYNEDNEEYGGYANDSLDCYDAVIDGVTFSNLFCYSELIDELVDSYGSQVTVSSNRISSTGNRDKSQSSGYWTLWSSYTGDYYTTYVLNGSAIGGPSWK